MKTTCRFAVILSAAIVAGSASLTSASGTWQPASWVVATGRIGQFNFLKRQPKPDPFKDASGSVERLMNEKKNQAGEHLRQGRDALAQGDLPTAAFHHDRALAMGATFAPGEDSPARLAADIQRQGGQVAPAPHPLPAASNAGAPLTNQPGAAPAASYTNTGPRYAAFDSGAGLGPRTAQGIPTYVDPRVQPASGSTAGSTASQAVYQPQRDTTYNRQVTGMTPAAAASDIRFTPPGGTGPVVGRQMGYESSAASPSAPTPTNDRSIRSVLAPAYPSASAANAGPVGGNVAAGPISAPTTTRSLPTAVTRGSTPANPVAATVAAPGGTALLDQAAQAEEQLKRQVMAEVARQSRQALDIRQKDPLGAVGQLQKTRAMISESALSGEDKQVLLTRVDRMLGELEDYVERHRAEIELNEHNAQILDDLQRKRDYKVEVQERLALLVDEYNKLRNEQRFYEAEVKAKEARVLMPDEPVVTQMFEEIRFHRRVANNRNLEETKENAAWETWNAVEFASIPYGDDRDPIRFMDHGDWEALSARRRQYAGDPQRTRHPAEIEIDNKLSTPVSLKFKDEPLSGVIQYMKQVAGINIHLDPQGLAEEGVHPSTPVTIDLSQEISLRSALNLILGPLHLNYVIKNEVLKITSEQLRDRTVYPKTYNVADLVIPIPDFVPHDQLGLPNAIARGYDITNHNLAGAAGFQPPIMTVAEHTGMPGIATPAGTLAQNSGGFASPGRPGGTSNADFDALIELITKTIEPDSWDEVGGPGSVAEFETNLSLVISQTQEVHEKIADLLEQLRRLQDLQVTIEVRFITLNDNFFERIGIDFDFNIDDNVPNSSLPGDDSGPSTTIGLGFNNAGLPTGNTTGAMSPIMDLINGNNDIQVRQGSAASVVPAFGGFDPASATTFGVAILSDIEAYFLVQAAQGDNRTNILQSPKVTLFNGQAASISDQVQQPFVTSVTPVVGDFAAAQAPVIVVLAEGTTLSVQAVVSPDRRFVRLTLIPFFSEIRDVNEFTFTGSTTSTTDRTDSNQEDGAGGTSNSATNNTTNFTEGTTIQLPTFAFTTVTTTVSVPDGGTVLLGGIKRLREARNELGTPFLSKLPYVSRLFKNVGVGRESQSLMLMVTPRIIIQEEEEEKLGLALP